MKNKKVAGLFAIFLGTIGLHKFYLNQPNKALVRIILLFVFFYLELRIGIRILFLVGVFEGIMLLMMSDEKFNQEYNSTSDFQTQKRPWGRSGQPVIPKSNPYKKSGIEKYKEFDFPGAIDDFTKALVLDPNDIVTHFNLACAYSQMEETHKSLYHLNKAIQYGFTDYDKINSNPGLAFLRTTQEFEEWNTKRVISKVHKNEIDPELKPDLLAQIKILNEKRERGEIDDDLFFEERRKLLM